MQELPSDVVDYVFGDINASQVSKIHAVANALNGEAWWFYPSGASNECDRYVVWNYNENHWSIGTMNRTAAVDAGVFRDPLWISSAGVVYAHENGLAYGGAEVFAESGPIALGNGDRLLAAVSLLPDEKTQGDVTVTFKARNYPNAAETTYGPYTMANPTSVRFTGRQVRMRVTGARLADWRFGVPRLDAREGSGR